VTGLRHAFTLGDMVRENARSLPDVEALVCGTTRLTYRRLDERVDRTAGLLAGSGVRAGDRVAYLGHGCHRAVEVILACAKLGAVAAPLNWRLSTVELDGVVRQLAPRVVVAPSTVDFDGAIVIDDASLAGAPVPEMSTVDEDAPVLELFTAAFTGRPRGVLLTHRGILTQNLVLAALREVAGPGEVYLASGPMFHVGALLRLFALLHLGGRTVIIPRVEPDAVCRAIATERCTSAFLFTPTIGELVAHNASGRYDLSSLRTVPGLPPEPARAAWYAMTSCEPPTDGGVTGYGQTETYGMVTFTGRPPTGTGPFGRPSPMVVVRIVDEHGTEVPDGEPGEIVVRGPQVMLGYDGEPPDPDGWHHTNDLGRREPDGSIAFLGPRQDLIKTGMENVYPAEVESVLRAHPAVRDACVIGVPDPVWGQSVRAVVQPVPGRRVASEELVDFVRTRIAGYKKPRSVILVEDLPRTGPAIDRDEVKRLWSA
jgi:acyl-CoA synthetase (AMP-forming)/AMP-acid ligase II